MEYQKITNLLDNKQKEPLKIRARNWVEINDDHEERINPVIKLIFKLQW